MNSISTSLRALRLYHQFFSVTSHCPDQSLKSYIRRRIRQDYRKNINAKGPQVEAFLNKAEEQLKKYVSSINQCMKVNQVNEKKLLNAQN